jgi:hypothetical protein
LLPAIATLLLAAAALPPECEQPELRDVLPLKQLAQLDGALSVGLDSVATWCFDPGGAWTAGIQTSPMKGKSRPNPNAEPVGDCAKAIASCEAALRTSDKPPLRELAQGALADLERTYHNAHYTPKRSGLKDKPNEKADCHSHERSELFAEAQSRMDLARLTSQIQNEYANYKSWLVQEGMRCRGEVFTAKKGKDNTRVKVAVDQPSKPARDPEPAKVAAVEPAKPDTAKGEPPPASWVTERETALARPMADKWRYLADQTAKQETDRDYTLGFLASRELRTCDCTRVNPAAIVRSLDKNEGSKSLLEAEDGPNTKCTVCALDAFSAWKPRAEKQCKQMDELTDYELSRLEKTDDANGIPPRCFDDTRARRAAQKKAEEDLAAAKARLAAAAAVPLATTAAPSPADGGRVAAATPTAGTSPAGVAPVAGNAAPPGSSGAATRTPAGAAPAAGGTAPGSNAAATRTPAGAGNPVAAGTATPSSAGPTPAAGGAGSRPAVGAATPTVAGAATPTSAGAAPSIAAGSATATAATPTPAGAATPGPGAAAAPSAQGTATAPGPNTASSNLVTVNGMTYYRPGGAGSPPAAAAPAAGGPIAMLDGGGKVYAMPTSSPGMTGPGVPSPPGMTDTFVPPEAWAPIPPREDGRMYVRLSMSSACVAEIMPGPIQARTGDLLLVPYGAKNLAVRSPCGGLAEIYWGKEPKPRFSEVFGRNQALKFEFKTQ